MSLEGSDHFLAAAGTDFPVTNDYDAGWTQNRSRSGGAEKKPCFF